MYLWNVHGQISLRGDDNIRMLSLCRFYLRMCDILHLRHTKIWLRPDWLFNLSRYGKDQIRLLEIIHGLTKKVIAHKKKDFKSGKRNVIDVSAQSESTETIKVITSSINII